MPRMTPPERIAVFLPNPVGDVVMATPALRALRKRFDSARIAFVARPQAIETLGGTDLADETITDISRRRPRLLNHLRLARRLRAGNFDLAVLFPNSFRTAMLSRLGGIRAAGYSRDGRGWMLRHRLRPPRDERGRISPVPTIDYYLSLVEMLGARGESRKMSLPVTEGDESAAEALLDEAGADRARAMVMLNPGAAFGPSKLWRPERFAAVADALIERRGAQIIINAAPAERPVARLVREAMHSRPGVSFDQRDNTLGLLKSLVRRCSLVITGDTGVRHFAAAFDTPVVTLFGSTDPVWARIDYDKERIIRVDVPCGPCQKKRCPLPAGPEHHQCMEKITSEIVLSAAEELLDGAEAAR